MTEEWYISDDSVGSPEELRAVAFDLWLALTPEDQTLARQLADQERSELLASGSRLADEDLATRALVHDEMWQGWAHATLTTAPYLVNFDCDDLDAEHVLWHYQQGIRQSAVLLLLVCEPDIPGHGDA